MTLAAALKAERTRRKLTQERFAATLDVPLSTYQGYEQGKDTPRPDRAEALEQALEASRKVDPASQSARKTRRTAQDVVDQAAALPPGAAPDWWRMLVEDHGPLAFVVFSESGYPSRLYKLGGGVVQLAPPPFTVESGQTAPPVVSTAS